MPRLDDAVDRLDALVDRLPLLDGRTTFVIALVTFLALLARLVLLGDRIAHFDEGRVAVWALHFMETGEIHYRYIVHGPFLQYVSSVVFSVLGANDFTMRLPVAIIGGLLPASVLLFREHLRDSEMVAAALFLAFNPILLYYSRFYRSTVPVAAFAFVSFGLFVRLYDTRRLRYLHAAVAFIALAFAAKENAVVYVLVWIGASALLLDYGLFRPRNADSGIEWIGKWWDRYVRGVSWRGKASRYLGHLSLAVAVGFVVIVYFFAPRAGNTGGLGLWKSLANGNVGALLNEMFRDIGAGLNYWFKGRGGGSARDLALLAEIVGLLQDLIAHIGKKLQESYAHFFKWMVFSLRDYAAPMFSFAVIGFVIERYGTRRRRNLVMFTGYWGFVSVFGYPLGTDIASTWITVNVLVPLSIPAGVALALFYRWGREGLADDDYVSVTASTAVLVLVGWFVVSTGVTAVYAHPQDPSNGLLQFAQPTGDLRPTLHDMRDLAAQNGGTDLLVYGSNLVARGGDMEPSCTRIRNTLPLEWYVGIFDVRTTCVDERSRLRRMLKTDPPPVIFTNPQNAEEVRDLLPGYEKRKHHFRVNTRYGRFEQGPAGTRVFFLDTARVNASG